MTYAKEWPYYSKINKQIYIMTLSYYSNKSIFLKADCVRSKHEKHSQDSRENCRVRTIWICQGKYNSTYLTTTFIHFDYKILKYVWTRGFSFAWKIKSMVFLTTFYSSYHENMLNYEKSAIKVFLHILYLMQKSYRWRQKAYLIWNMWRYDSYQVQSAKERYNGRAWRNSRIQKS